MEEQKVYFHHGTSIDGYKFTIAGRFPTESPIEDTLCAGIAICSSKDAFNKKLGRTIAEGRCKKERSTRGRTLLSLYDEEEGRTQENWYKGKEVKAFLLYATQFNEKTREEITKSFNL